MMQCACLFCTAYLNSHSCLFWFIYLFLVVYDIRRMFKWRDVSIHESYHVSSDLLHASLPGKAWFWKQQYIIEIPPSDPRNDFYYVKYNFCIPVWPSAFSLCLYRPLPGYGVDRFHCYSALRRPNVFAYIRNAICCFIWSSWSVFMASVLVYSVLVRLGISSVVFLTS